jgi:hypothetical protein
MHRVSRDVYDPWWAPWYQDHRDRHVQGAGLAPSLGKHVDISPEEGDECEFLFAVQITRDTGSLSSLRPDLDSLYGDIFLVRGLHAGC